MKATLFLFLFSSLLGLPSWAREQVTLEDRVSTHSNTNDDDPQEDRPQCQMDDTVVTIQWDEVSSQFMLIDEQNLIENRRRLNPKSNVERSHPFQLRVGRRDNIDAIRQQDLSSLVPTNNEPEWTRGIQVYNVRLNVLMPRRLEDTTETNAPFQVRTCRCNEEEPVFCPVALEACSYMGHDEMGNATVACFKAGKRNEDLPQTCLFVAVVGLLYCFVAWPVPNTDGW